MIRGAAFAGAAPRTGEIMISMETWHGALDIAWRLVDENGFRYRVWRNERGRWCVARAGRRAGRRP